uniref:Autophagy-related protein 101 n=1 Tax=Polytomella parva TaxID=51329 RepID=A0A7S0VCQ7_9CHLO|mmetsp:Transcript_34805/g.62609  ORF Transcript_34805/g.62609 Transcript_34805/m.62609 type:complete len:248 (+) Transcript_34805:79-822(+)
MSNCEAFDLGNIDVEPHHTKEVLRCVFHTIIFNRALGFVRPRESDCELFDVTYVSCLDSELERQVEARISEICSVIGRIGNNTDTLKVSLTFYEKMKRQQGWFGGNQERKLYWERWQLSLRFNANDFKDPFSPPPSTYSLSHSLSSTPYPPVEVPSLPSHYIEEQVEDILASIATHAMAKKDHLPPVGDCVSPLTFPFEISFSVEGGARTVGRLSIPLPSSLTNSIEGGVQAMRKLLAQAPPPPNIL